MVGHFVTVPALAGVIVLVVGCAGPTVPSPSREEPSTAPRASPSAPVASPTAGPSSAAVEVPLGDLAAGTYHHARFEPRIELTLGDGWHNLASSERDYDRSLFIRRSPEPGGEAIMFDVAGAQVEPGESIERRLALMPGVEAGPLVATAIGGAAGVQVDGSALEESVIPSMSEEYFLSPGDRFRLIAIDVRGRTLLIVVEGSADDWDGFLPIAEAVLASVRFLVG